MGLLIVLWFMGMHSAFFFGPGKYGILPEAVFAKTTCRGANGRDSHDHFPWPSSSARPPRASWAQLLAERGGGGSRADAASGSVSALCMAIAIVGTSDGPDDSAHARGRNRTCNCAWSSLWGASRDAGRALLYSRPPASLRHCWFHRCFG